MKIIEIIHGYPPEYNAGSEVYSQSVCNELNKYHEVSIFSREENDYEPDFSIRETITDVGIPHFRVNMARSKDGYNHKLLNENFKDLVIKLKPDVAHIGHLNHLSIGIIDILNELNIPILYTLHDFWLMCPRGQFLQRNFDGSELYQLCTEQNDEKCADSCYAMYYKNTNDKPDKEYWSNWINQRMTDMKLIASKINRFHAPSRYLMNRFISEFIIPAEKIFYLDYGFPLHYLRPIRKHKNKPFTFGYIGTHIPAKGINLLLDAFAKIEGEAELKIFGRTNGQNTNALKAKASTIKNKVIFAGEYVNQNLADVVFSNIDCIVVPSIWGENSPLVIHEAQACHIPVITADFGGMAEYVQHNVNGLLFKHRDIVSLTQQMEFALQNPEHLKKIGERGYLYNENGNVPSIEDHCLELTNCFKKLIENEK
ncbi:MAG: glycosyltransferase [Bacteroidales bacterium]|nr:glycosyltransferase [Bacteroidales bacterium]